MSSGHTPRRAASTRPAPVRTVPPRFLAPHGRAVVVTGTSSGLGRACARHLAAAGFKVFAGVRTPTGETLPPGIEQLGLDVTDPASIAAARDAVRDRVGDTGLWGLVNNAGICVCAPLECLPLDDLRRQLETSVVGQIATTQALLPLLRTAGGRVVNVTSGLGNVAIPYLGAYAAAMWAKEAFSDALRRELAPSGVRVSIVQPGSIPTPIWDKVSGTGTRVIDAAPEPLQELYRATFVRFLHTNEQSALTSRTTPEDFAGTVLRALASRRPRSRYAVGRDAALGRLLRRLLPDAALDRAFRSVVTPTGGTP
ncbi:short-chain dehydrogenase [Streptomyces sulfonofaciens]|uniref:Short-chain dehydrogenase n=1 Tax=Streptomyces sulfonofaciens TaxID=68272 RepID=A0A919GQL4_9ACTN|nr:SDR family oxidoreductase [Streptomyces sulfonofaciens]GHH88806.1 short-chain dehydrogenase [Streptomyces sulfonofaciens]